MPVLGDLLGQIAFLAAIPAVLGVAVTASMLVVSSDWRLNVFSLAAQYFFVALLMTRIIRVEMAAVKALIGWVICLVFYLTEQQTKPVEGGAETQRDLPVRDWFAARMAGWRQKGITARAAFNLMGVVVVGVAVYRASGTLRLPQLSRGLTLACCLLAALGILLVGLERDPLRVAIGLLTFVSGFDLFYVALEPSLVVAGLLGSISFGIALAATYVRAAQAAGGGEMGGP